MDDCTAYRRTRVAKQLTKLVRKTYEQRANDWLLAADLLENFAEDVATRALKDADATRMLLASRIKDQHRALDKLRKHERLATESPETHLDVEEWLNDIVGVKVLCKSVRDVNLFTETLDTLLEEGKAPFELWERKDYVTHPKPSGYRAYHYIFKIPVPDGDPVICELQVKSRLQDAWSELTHEDLYKPGAALKPDQFHQAIAMTMANLLAEVDKLAATLAEEVETSTTYSPESGDQRETVMVDVRQTGRRYALAVDDAGRQGLVPGRHIRELVGNDAYVEVDDYIHLGDELEVIVEEDDRGVFYLPLRLPER